jgi:UDP-xylose:glucoside alpha-1,3-xylosyltransferase
MMRWFLKLLILLLASVAAFITVCYRFEKSFKTKMMTKSEKSKSYESEVIVSVVACGESRTEELFTMIKSGLVFSKQNVHIKFIIISEPPLFQLIREKMESFQSSEKNFSFVLKEISFPKENTETWRKLFKLCASQRLFLPSLLPNIDSILYVDSDTIFLSPPEDIFEKLLHFNTTQIAGLVPESENKKFGWYSRFARHPFYG